MLNILCFTGPKRRKVEKIENISDVTQCPVCKKKDLKRVLKHIERSKSCKTKCPKDVLEALKEKSKNITLKNKI